MKLSEEQMKRLLAKVQFGKLREDECCWKKGSTYIILENEGPLFWTVSNSREESLAKLIDKIERYFK